MLQYFMSRDNILQYSRVSESCCVIGDDCVILLSKNVKKKLKHGVHLIGKLQVPHMQSDLPSVASLR